MKDFCLDLREHATKIIGYEKEIILLKNEEKNYAGSKRFVMYTKKDYYWW